jgi:hypothetical protein
MKQFNIVVSIFTSLFLCLPMAQSFSLGQVVAECQYQVPVEKIDIAWRVLHQGSATIVEVRQIHPRFASPTQVIRHVQQRITHDYWEYTNHVDFKLLILPGDQGRFTGNLSGIIYRDLPLACQFAR